MRDVPPGFFLVRKFGGGFPLHPVASVDYSATQSVGFCFAGLVFLFSVVVAAAPDIFVIGKSWL
jgi:hypothetical protein